MYMNSKLMLQHDRLRKLLSRQKKESVDSLMVMTTYTCQFKCSYCEVQRAEKKRGLVTMPEQVLRDALLFLSTSKSQSLLLRFFGGEPLLKFDLIKKAIEYAQGLGLENGKRYRFSIVTNGLLLDDAVLGYLSRHKVHIMFSADGRMCTQKEFRVLKSKDDEAYRRIEENLRRLISSGMDCFVNMLVVPDNIDAFYDNVMYFVNLGVKNIQICYQAGVYWESEVMHKFISSLGKLILMTGRRGNDFTILNLYNQAEPVVASDEIIVDCDGEVYLDSAIFMERCFPELRKTYHLGSLHGQMNIDSLSFSEIDLFQRLMRTYPAGSASRRILLNNVYFGLIIKKFLSAYIKSG